jgi:PAS domain S-box-containing protein
MSEPDDLRSENARLRGELDDARQAIGAFARGEVDAVASESSATPVLLLAAQAGLRRSEDALRESRDMLEAAQATAHLGSWTAGLGPGSELRWSRECYRILGVPEATPMTAGAFLAYVHPGDRERVRRASLAATEHGAPYDLEHRVLRPDGRLRWIHEIAVLERDAVGRPTRMTGTVQDITDRHLAGEALRASEERYRRIVENTSEGVWTYDAAGVTTFINARMAEMLGCTVAAAVGQSILTFVHPSDRAEFRALLARRPRDGAGRSDAHLRREDGTDLWVSVQANPLFDAEGAFDGVLALLTDVSLEHRGNEARARLATIVESSEDAIVSMALDGAITTWNRSAERLHLYSADEVVGTSIFLHVPAAVLAEERRIFERAAGGEAVRHHDTRRIRKDGSEIEVALTIFPIRDAAGSVIGVSKIARDLTDRRRVEAALHRTEEQFRQAQKMEAVGRLAGGIAHDFNNLLSVILSYSTLAVDELKPGDPLRDDIVEIQKAGERATGLTRQLLAFSRQQILEPRVIDLNQILAGMEGMLRRLLGEDVHVTLLPAPELGRVRADPGQLEQVVMNFAVNARDAMPDGGALTIETLNVELDETYVGAHADVAPGSYVMLAISDTGTGMDAATRARVFEPFFTTKDQGKGTGLGLATVFGIVQQSGGHVGVDSEPGCGSTFKVYLPRNLDAATSPATADARIARRGSETILLVEDEDQVRAVACTILRRHGYHVLEASNGGEALLVARDFTAKIDLLLTDVVMPRMSGRKLAEQLAPRRPEMKVIFASGYTDDAIIHHGVLDAGVAFLQKPFTPRALLNKVRERLDAPVHREDESGP